MGYTLSFQIHGSAQSQVEPCQASSTCLSRTGVPLLLALLLHAVMGGLEVNISICVGSFQVANVGGRTVEVHLLIASFALDPRSCGPLADAPVGLLWRASNLAITVDVAVAPAALAGKLPKGCARNADLCANTVGVILVAPRRNRPLSWEILNLTQ